MVIRPQNLSDRRDSMTSGNLPRPAEVLAKGKGKSRIGSKRI